MGLILHKGLSTKSGHYISMEKDIDIWFECDDEVRLTISVTLTLFICYLTMKRTTETFMGHWAGPNGNLLSKLMRRHQNSMLNRFPL